MGGTVSSVGKEKEDLLINSLIESKKGKINEVIIATSATVEGMTAYYIKDSLKGINI